MTTTDLALATFAGPLDNPMWDLLRDAVRPGEYAWEGPQVGGLRDWERLEDRFDIAGRYAWTIADPPTVAFVATVAGPRVIDPLAGSGYWAYLLGQLGADVLASDMTPPDGEANSYHRAGVQHVPVGQGDAVDAVTEHGDGRTLLLSWPPYAEALGAEILAAYPGDRVIYIGEGHGGCCGDDDMFEAFEQNWVEIATHRPVQFWGIHDYVTVYDRKAAS